MCLVFIGTITHDVALPSTNFILVTCKPTHIKNAGNYKIFHDVAETHFIDVSYDVTYVEFCNVYVRQAYDLDIFLKNRGKYNLLVTLSFKKMFKELKKFLKTK